MLRRIKKYFFCFCLTGISFFLADCKKITQARIKGIWQSVNVAHIEQPGYEKWTFEKHGVLRIKMTYKLNNDTLYSDETGKFRCKSKNIFEVRGFSAEGTQLYNVNWEIIDLSKRRLLIANDQNGQTGLMFKEFYRIGEE